ncbi:MAG: prepilin peptidase [Gemmatimonadota bacterium]|nr:prepilin peptidase [Gemmatimonadota bacterium]
MPTQPIELSAPLSVILVMVLALAVWFDVKEKRIPNWITAGGFVVALVSRGVVGPGALWVGLLGGGLGLVLGILFFSAGAMGAGDGKLLASVGALLGLDTFLWCLPLIGAFGGLLALAVTARKGTLIPTLLRFRELTFYFVTFGRIGDRRTLSTPGAVTVPYGVAVAAGAVTAWLGWGLTL